MVARSSSRRRRGGHLQGHHRQAVVEVEAEVGRRDRLAEVAGRRRDQPGAERDGLVGAERLEDALLQGPEELRLEGQRQIPDLVQQQGPLPRPLEPAHAPLVSAGERAPGVAEELGFQQLAGQRSAVHRHERLRRPGGVGVNGAGEDLFAGAGLAGDQHRDRHRGDPTELAQQRLDGRGARVEEAPRDAAVREHSGLFADVRSDRHAAWPSTVRAADRARTHFL
jgi:hypothetical protein